MPTREENDSVDVQILLHSLLNLPFGVALSHYVRPQGGGELAWGRR